MGGLVLALVAGLGLMLVTRSSKAASGERFAGQAFPGVPNEIAFEGLGLGAVAAELCGSQADYAEIEEMGQLFVLAVKENPEAALSEWRDFVAERCPGAAALTRGELLERGEQVALDVLG